MSAVVRSRMDESLKQEAEEILRSIGITPSDAIRLLYKQVVNRGTFPLELKLPNAETQAAINESKSNARLKTYDSFDELLDETT